MKRILIWLLILAMALSFPVTVFADPATQTVYGQVLESVDLIPGRTFAYEISIRDNLGFITGATTITWPAADFELKAVEFGLNLKDNGSMEPGTNVNGTYTAVFGEDTATQNTTDNGVLLTLTFEILESATAGTKAINLTFGRDEDDFIAFHPTATPSVPTAFESGSVTLTEVHQTVYGQVIDLQNLIPEEEFTYEVGIRDNFGIVTGACKLSWSKDDFDLIGITFGTGMPDNGSQPITEAEDGDYIVSFGSDTMTADYTGNGTLFTLTFKIKSTATAGKKDIGITFGYDEDDFLNFGQYRMPTAFEPGSVTLQAINQTVYGATIEKGLSVGKTFTYDVSISGNVGIVVGAVKVSWPKTAFELTGITFVGMADNDTPSVETATNGEFIVQFGDDTATTDYTEDGVLFTLTFKIAEGAQIDEYPIALTYGHDEADFQNAHIVTIPTNFTAGKVTLVEVTGYDITGTAVGWNNIDNIVYLLYSGTVSDADIKTDMVLDTPTKALEVEVTKGSFAENADGKRTDQSFLFEDIEPGDYKLVIFKPNGYVPIINLLTIDSDDIDVGAQELWLYGDVNGNGELQAIDVTMARQYYKGVLLTLTDSQIARIDMNGDGAIAAIDITILRQYYKGVIDKLPLKY